MAIACDAASLTAAAKCFDCIPKSMRTQVMLYLLAVEANALNGTSMDPATLVNLAKCFTCVPKNMVEPVMNYLLCQIAAASGA